MNYPETGKGTQRRRWVPSFWAYSACLSVLFFASGCRPYVFDPADSARALAEAAGWREYVLDAKGLALVGFVKLAPGAVRTILLRVYIEGDGRAWETRATPATDPTPDDPVALKLALADPSPAVAYLARPCQYVRTSASRACDVRFWTSARYGEEVVAATDRAVSELMRLYGANSIGLVGFSGGGAVAALVAARRADVARIVTVAGVLDHAEWTRIHDATPLRESINPADFGALLGNIPQVHFVGARDPIVPAGVALSYLARMPKGTRADMAVIPDQTHECCWPELWRDLVARAFPE